MRLGCLVGLLLAACVAASELVQQGTVNPGLGAVPAELARHSPAASWRGFLATCALREYGKAQHYLDLGELDPEEQAREGVSRAEQLCRLVVYLSARPGQVTVEDPQGPTEAGVPANEVSVLRFARKGINGEITLRRVRELTSGQGFWLFAPRTLASVPFWYQVLILGQPPRPSIAVNAGLPPRPEVQRGAPREAFVGFWEAARAGDFLLAAHYLDLDALPPAEQPIGGPKAARRLFLLLLRQAWVAPEKLSDWPSGTREEGLPEDRERVARVELRGRTVELLLGDTYDPAMGHLWRFAPETLAELPHLYRRFGYGWLGDHAPSVLFSLSFLGFMAWQWVVLLLLVVAGFWLSRWLGKVVIRLGQRALATSLSPWVQALKSALQAPLGLWLWVVVLYLGLRYLGLPGEARQVALTGWRLLTLTAVVWFVYRLQDDGFARWREQAQQQASLALAFIPIFHRFARFLLVLFAFLVALHLVGVPVTTALAGLGIGGVAVAFAAQKSLENVFAALAIAADRPFKVGDTVRIGSLLGVVEDVGLRSCRLRTPERTLVTVPNSVVVGSEVVNLSERDRILFNPTLGLAYSTGPERLRRILQGIRQHLGNHPRVVKEGVRCQFRGFGESALQVEVFCWLATLEWEEYLALAEELNFALAEIVAREGGDFAFPTRTVFLRGEANAAS